MAVPLLVGDRLMGGLTLDSFEAGFYTPQHADMARAFAAFAATAIDRVLRHRSGARPGGCGVGGTGEERVPRHHEPRDQDADERRDRHDRLLLDTDLTAEQREFAEDVRSSGNACST